MASWLVFLRGFNCSNPEGSDLVTSLPVSHQVLWRNISVQPPMAELQPHLQCCWLNMLLFVFLTLLSYVILTLLCEHCARIINWTLALPAAVVILELELIPSAGFTVNKLLQIRSFAEFAWCSWGNFRLHSWAVWLCLSRMLWLLARHRRRNLFHQGIWRVVQIVLFQACQG